MINKQAMLEDLIVIIKKVVAEDWIEEVEVEIDLDTSFNEDFIINLIENNTYATNAKRIASSFINAGGVRRVTTLPEELVP